MYRHGVSVERPVLMVCCCHLGEEFSYVKEIDWKPTLETGGLLPKDLTWKLDHSMVSHFLVLSFDVAISQLLANLKTKCVGTSHLKALTWPPLDEFMMECRSNKWTTGPRERIQIPQGHIFMLS